MLYKLLCSSILAGSFALAQDAAPKNIILFIGDGMGPQQVLAAQMYHGAPLSFESLPYQALCTTHSANASVTDSAAAATAIATGVKVNNGVISVALPGDGSELETLLEFYRDQGKKTGLITTAYLTHATPAGFGAHTSDRNNTTDIGQDLLYQTKPNILFGGGGNGLTPITTATAGYAVATTTAGFNALDPAAAYLAGLFGSGYMDYEADSNYDSATYPHLTEMVLKALDALEEHPNGFFLMIEAGRIDHACHSNLLPEAVHEALELSRAVDAALTWIGTHPDTLLIVTADHETGGLTILADQGMDNYPDVSWSSGDHTAANVPVYALGPNAEKVTGLVDNTELHTILAGGIVAPRLTLVPAGAIWRYLDDGSDQGLAWREPGFDDSVWPPGPAQLGYGEGDEATVVSYGPDPNKKYRTTYFRHAFSVTDPGQYDAMSVSLLRDDGAIVYLNGTEIFRSNMPGDPVNYQTYASTVVGNADEVTFFETSVDCTLLVPGLNVLAVELHQANDISSDLSFDLQLEGGVPVVHSVTLLDPADGTVVTTSPHTFTAEVLDEDGLASATLVLAAATNPVIFSGPALIDDAQITADTPNTPAAGSLSINVDSLAPHAHGLMRFNNLIGNAAGQVPPNATIISAALEVNCSNLGDLMTAYRLLEDWEEATVTWNNRSSNESWASAGADGPPSHDVVGLPVDCSTLGWRTIDITDFVQDWANGAANHGLVFIDGGNNGVDFDSSESANSPVLTVHFASSPVSQTINFETGLTSAQVSFDPVPLVDGVIYSWNCRLLDDLGNESWAAAPAVFTYDTHYPNIPVLLAPADGATGVATSPNLEVTVSDPDAEETLDVAFFGRPTTPTGDPFTIVVLPDTQFYSESRPDIFTAQTEWIVSNRAAENIVFVTHEGDLVNVWDSTAQWANAYTSLNILKTAGIPFGMAPGNHDQENGTGASPDYNHLFADLAPHPTLIDTYADPAHSDDLNDNSAHLFSASGVDLLLLQLEYSPSADVLNWANNLIQSHPYRLVIITTHAYLNVDTSLLQPVIYNSLVAPNPNVRLVLCGHVSGEALRTDLIGDRQVHQLLADYQNLNNGGDGYLRILEFIPAENKIAVKTYSPTLNQPQIDADSQFELTFPLDGYQEIGTAFGVANGAAATMLWGGLELAADYEWFAIVTDPTGRRSQSPVWSFRTISNDSTPPLISELTESHTDTTATISWSTDEDATSILHYRKHQGGNWLNETGPGYTTVHSLTLTGLTPDTLYDYWIESADREDNIATVGSESVPLPFTTDEINLPPVANDQLSVETKEDTPIAITLTGSDPNGDNLSFSIIAGPSHGSLSGTAPSVTYTPGANYNGPDSFRFVVNDGQLDSAEATVSITVNPLNDAPVALDQSVTISEDTASSLTLTATDVDAGDTLFYSIIGGPLHGSLSGTAPLVIYTPDLDYFGPDSFQFKVHDGTVDSIEATVSITVNPVNDAPVATGQSVATPEDTAVAISLTATDADVGDTLSCRITTEPSNGTAANDEDGFTYTPDSNWNGTDSFEFVANDGQLDSAPATITISVSAVNDPPTAPANFSATAGDGMVTLSWTPSVDPDGDDLTYTVVRDSIPIGSGLTQNSYIDKSLQNDRTYSYIVRVYDGTLTAETGAIPATPTAMNPNAYVVAEPTIIIGALGGDSFETLAPNVSGAQTLSEARGGQFGRLEAHYVLQTLAPPSSINSVSLHLSSSLTADDAPWQVFVWRNSQWAQIGDFPAGMPVDTIFALSPGDVAADGTIQIAILDGADIKRESYDTLNLETLYAEIQAGPAVNHPPVAAPLTVSTTPNTSINITLQGSDVDGGPLTYSIKVTPWNGTATLNGDVVTYKPNGGFTGQDSFDYQVTDPDELSATATVTVTVSANQPPVAVDDSANTTRDTPVTLAVLANDTDPEGDPVTLLDVSIDSAQGTAQLNADDTITYTPASGFTGTATLTYTITDGFNIATGDVNITVTEPTTFSVEVVDVSITSAGKNSKATAEVEVLDSSGNPVVGATVTGEWFYDGKSIGTTSGTTDSSGLTLLTSAPVKTTMNLFTVEIRSVELGTP